MVDTPFCRKGLARNSSMSNAKASAKTNLTHVMVALAGTWQVDGVAEVFHTATVTAEGKVTMRHILSKQSSLLTKVVLLICPV